MRLQTTVKAVMLAAMGAALPLGLTHGTEAAGCTPTHCIAEFLAQHADTDGGYAVFDVETYHAPDYNEGGHSNHSLWVADASGNNWCETGWTKGGFRDSNNQWSGGYSNYYAYQSHQSYSQFMVPYAVGDPGTEHTYQVWRTSGSGFAQVYIDLSYQGSCPIPVPVYTVAVGLEYTDTTAANATVNPHDLQFRDYQTGDWEPWSFADALIPNLVGPGSNVGWVTPGSSFNDWSN